VLTQQESSSTARGYLYVNVNTKATEELYAIAIDLSFVQPVLLARDPSITVSTASTWSSNSVATVGKHRLRGVRDGIKDILDYFINDYLSVNQK